MLCKSAVLALGLSVVFSPALSLAQTTPLAGSAGAGNSAISGIPAGPANNSTVYDPSGIGNASKMPALPSQAAIPVTPASPGYGNTVVVPRSLSSREFVRCAGPRYGCRVRRVRPGPVLSSPRGTGGSTAGSVSAGV